MSGCHEDVKQLDISATSNPTQATPGSRCWILVQQNDGSDDSFFHRNWKNYTEGFGDASGNFWIGNHRLRQMTKRFHNGFYFDVY